MTKTKGFRPTRSGDDDEAPLPVPVLPPNASAGRRWKFRRNLVIYVAHRGGFSQRFLADVFDLPRSSIASILKDLKRFEAAE